MLEESENRGGRGAARRGAQARARKEHSVYHTSKILQPRKSGDVRSRRADGREDGVREWKQSGDDQALPIKTGRALNHSQGRGAQEGVTEKKTSGTRSNPKKCLRVSFNKVPQVRGTTPFRGHDLRVLVSTNWQRHGHLYFHWVGHGWRLTVSPSVHPHSTCCWERVSPWHTVLDTVSIEYHSP